MKKIISLLLAASIIFTLSAGLLLDANAVNATPISFNQTINSSINSRDSKDYYFNVPAKGEINLMLIKNSFKDLDVSIYDSNYELLIKYGDYEHNELTEEYTLNLIYTLMPGKHYLRLSNGWDDKPYQLKMTYKKSAAKPTTFKLPSNKVEAMQIELGETIRTTIPSRGYQNYVFNTNISGTINLVVKKKNFRDLSVSLYNSKFKEVTKFSEYDYNEVTETYTLKSQYYINKGVYYLRAENGWDNKLYSISLSFKASIAAPSKFRCTARNTSAQKVAWNKVSGVNGYQVQRSNNGGTAWSSYYSTSGNSYVFSSLTAGGKYKFRVRAYKDVSGTRYYGSWSSTLCSCCTPAKPVLRGVSSPKHTQIKTTWTKAGGTKSGYQILYGKNASFSSIAARKNVSGAYSSYTGKNFTKGRSYYVKVRTYTTFNGKAYYSAWSSAKKVKCK